MLGGELNKSWKEHPTNQGYKDTCLLNLRPFKSDEQYMLGTAGEVRTKSKATFSSGPFHTDEQVLDKQKELIYSSTVRYRMEPRRHAGSGVR